MQVKLYENCCPQAHHKGWTVDIYIPSHPYLLEIFATFPSIFALSGPADLLRHVGRLLKVKLNMAYDIPTI